MPRVSTLNQTEPRHVGARARGEQTRANARAETGIMDRTAAHLEETASCPTSDDGPQGAVVNGAAPGAYADEALRPHAAPVHAKADSPAGETLSAAADTGLELPALERLQALLASRLPLCHAGEARVVTCELSAVIAGRRGSLFGIVDVTVERSIDREVISQRLVVQRFPLSEGVVEEGRKMLRRLRHRARAQRVRKRFRPWAAFLADERLLVLPFPFDYRMPSLVSACTPDQAMPRLAALLGHPVTNCTLTPVRYVPDKRCQLQIDIESTDGATRVYGKVTAGAQSPRLVEWMRVLHDSLRASGAGRTPAPVGYVDDWQMLVQHRAPGETLYRLEHTGGVAVSAYAAVGRALAAFHRTELPDLPHYTRLHELSLLDGMLKRARLATGHRSLAGRIFAWLVATGRSTERTHFTCHRDFYDKQVLVSDEAHTPEVWVIDLDTLARGPAALDVGNFVAHVHLRSRQGYVSPVHSQAAASRFLEAYRLHQPVDAESIRWFAVASLLRLAGVYAVRPAWRHLTGTLLDDANALVARQVDHVSALASLVHSVEAPRE